MPTSRHRAYSRPYRLRAAAPQCPLRPQSNAPLAELQAEHRGSRLPSPAALPDESPYLVLGRTFCYHLQHRLIIIGACVCHPSGLSPSEDGLCQTTALLPVVLLGSYPSLFAPWRWGRSAHRGIQRAVTAPASLLKVGCLPPTAPDTLQQLRIIPRQHAQRT